MRRHTDSNHLFLYQTTPSSRAQSSDHNLLSHPRSVEHRSRVRAVANTTTNNDARKTKSKRVPCWFRWVYSGCAQADKTVMVEPSWHTNVDLNSRIEDTIGLGQCWPRSWDWHVPRPKQLQPTLLLSTFNIKSSRPVSPMDSLATSRTSYKDEPPPNHIPESTNTPTLVFEIDNDENH